MSLNFVIGAAAGVKGYDDANDEDAARKQLAADRAYQTEQRDYLRESQKRDRKNQAEADQFKIDLKAIPLEREEVINPDRATALPVVDDDGSPSAAQLPAAKKIRRENDEIARDYAKALLKQGNLAESLKYDTVADDIGWKRSTKLFTQLDAAAPGSTPKQIVDQAAQIFNKDPFAGSIENIKYGADGSVAFDTVNRTTGQRTPKTFKDANQVMDDLRAFYTPDNFAMLQESRRKASQEAAKPYDLKPGERRYSGNKLISENPNMTSAEVADSRLQAQIAGLGGAGGVGGVGGKGGKAPATPADIAQGLLDDSLEKVGEKVATPELRARANDYLASALKSNPGLAPATASRIAIDAITNPGSLTPKLNYETGTIDRVYQNPEVAGGKRFSMADNYMTSDQFIKSDKNAKAALGADVKAMVMAQPEGNRASLLEAAFDPSKRKSFLIDVAGAKGYANDAAREQEVRRATQKMDLIGNFPELAPRSATESRPPSIKDKPGGFPGVNYVAPEGSPAARAQAQRNISTQQVQAKEAQQAKEAEAITSQFTIDSNSMPPVDLVRKYDSLRGQMSRSTAAALQAIERKL